MQFLPPATILIAVATRIYGFVSFGYASMPWQSILYGTFCVSRICHSRRVARFGHQHRHNLLEEKSRRSRLSKKRVFRNFEKTRSKKKIFQLEGFSISRKFSSRSRARGKVSRFFASSSLDFLETKFKNRIASNSVIDFRSLHRWENVAVALLNINKGGFHCQNNLVRILRGAGFHQVCMNPLRTN